MLMSMTIHLEEPLYWRLCIPAFVLPPAPPSGKDAEIRILCSNGIRAAMEKLLPEYQRTTGTRLKVQYGTSATSRRSIESGEPFDLTILTPQLVRDLIERGQDRGRGQKWISRPAVLASLSRRLAETRRRHAGSHQTALLKAKSIGYVKEGASAAAIADLFHHPGDRRRSSKIKSCFNRGRSETWQASQPARPKSHLG